MNFNTYIILYIYIYILIMVYYLTTIVTAAAIPDSTSTHCHSTHFNAMIQRHIYFAQRMHGRTSILTYIKLSSQYSNKHMDVMTEGVQLSEEDQWCGLVTTLSPVDGHSLTNRICVCVYYTLCTMHTSMSHSCTICLSLLISLL